MQGDRKILKIVWKLLLLFIPFPLCVCAVAFFPMRFLDGEYAAYMQNLDYSENHEEYCRVLIAGDSTAKAAWNPELLSEDTYNFALGGLSPIEEYYYLQSYLETNAAPEYLIYTNGIPHFLELDTFWTRSVYFHRMTWEQFCELDKDMEQYPDKSVLGSAGGTLRKEGLKYYLYSPAKYGEAFIKGILSPMRYRTNRESYLLHVKNKGHIHYGNAEYSDKVSDVAMLTSFRPNEVIDDYLQRIIGLCEEYDIKFILQGAPLNESTFLSMDKKVVEDYSRYMDELQDTWPDALIDNELHAYESQFFGDPVHLNTRGTEKFCKDMRKKYSKVFEG